MTKKLELEMLAAQIQYVESLQREEEAVWAEIEDRAAYAASLHRSKLDRKRTARMLRARGQHGLADRLDPPDPDADEPDDLPEPEPAQDALQEEIRRLREEVEIATGKRRRRSDADPNSRARRTRNLMRGRRCGPNLSPEAFRRWHGRDPDRPSDWESFEDYRAWTLGRD